MAILPLAARTILANLTTDLGMQPPAYSHDTDESGLITVTVAMQLIRPNLTPLEKKFTSLPEYSINIAEDIASRMALRYIKNYYIGNNRVSAYFNCHLFVRTKKSWQAVADRLANQLDKARDTIRSLHHQLHQSNLDHITQTDNIRNSHILDTLAATTHLQELTEETAKQRCQILLLENRLHYLETMNSLLCMNHQGLLQLPTTENTALSVNNVQTALHVNEATNMPPLTITRANLTEI